MADKYELAVERARCMLERHRYLGFKSRPYVVIPATTFDEAENLLRARQAWDRQAVVIVVRSDATHEAIRAWSTRNEQLLLERIGGDQVLNLLKGLNGGFPSVSASFGHDYDRMTAQQLKEHVADRSNYDKVCAHVADRLRAGRVLSGALSAFAADVLSGATTAPRKKAGPKKNQLLTWVIGSTVNELCPLVRPTQNEATSAKRSGCAAVADAAKLCGLKRITYNWVRKRYDAHLKKPIPPL